MTSHGANLIPEGLETGEFKVGGTANFDELEHVYCIAYTGDTINNVNIGQFGYDYNGIASSVTFIFANSPEGFHVLCQLLQQEGNSDKILTAFTLPKLAVLDKINEIETDPTVDYYYYEPMDYDYKQSAITKTLASTPSTIDGYTPRNQKLRTYPYIYLGFNPSNGSQKLYRYEDFQNGIPIFKLYSEINQNPTVAFIPQNYRGNSGDSLTDIVYLNGYPTISFKNDVFNTWLAQNGEIINIQNQHEENMYGLNTGTNIANGVTGFVGSLLSLNIGGMVNSVSNSITNAMALDENHDFYIKNQMAQIERQKMLPDNASLSSTNATLLGYNKMDENIFTRYTIKREFAEKIDKFFDMYGYLTNDLKLPNLNNRPHWNYVKTIGANILGEMPQNDLNEIKDLFNNGITLWHNPLTFLDYSQNNRVNV